MKLNKAPPWHDAYPPELDWQLEAVDAPVYRILEDSADAYPQRPCLDFLGSKFSYAEVLDLVNRFAAGLQQLGVKKTDRIGLCLPNSPYYVIAYIAALKAGAVVVNFNILYTAREIEQQVNDSGISMMVTLDLKFIFNKVYPCLEKGILDSIIFCPLADVLPPTKRTLLKIFKFFQFVHPDESAKLHSYETLIGFGEKPEPVPVEPDKDLALFQYTGGTTGIPKAAMLTHSNVLSNTEQVNLWLQQGEKLSGQEKFLAVLPFFHVFSMTVSMNLALRSGAEIYMLPRFELKQCLDLIDDAGITIFPGVPAIFNAINNYARRDHYRLDSLRYGICGGAALPLEVKRSFEENSHCVLIEGYGLSEASPVVTCNPAHNGGRPGSIGLPLPGTEVSFRQIEDINLLQDEGKVGQFLVRGPQVMQGYWNRAEESAATLLADGWLCTGDLGYMDAEGYVYLTDRLKDIIITNGYNVYPRVIEDAFYRHPDIAEVIAIGIPDAQKGEAPKVFVKAKPGKDLDIDELFSFAEDQLNPIEMPDSIEIRQELPKTLIGKPSKKALLEEEARKRNMTEE